MRTSQGPAIIKIIKINCNMKLFARIDKRQSVEHFPTATTLMLLYAIKDMHFSIRWRTECGITAWNHYDNARGVAEKIDIDTQPFIAYIPGR